MAGRLLKQAGVCIIIAAVLFVLRQSDIPVLKKSTEAVLEYMTVNYTTGDIAEAAGKAAEIVSCLAVITYGEPIDQKYEGGQTPVYAVAGGQVTAVGENEEIGKYIKIVHGDESESLYGNLKSTRVKVPFNVKKGQIIGIYEDTKDKEFYYSLNESHQ